MSEHSSYRRRSYIAVAGLLALGTAAALGIYAQDKGTDPLIDINTPIVKTPLCDSLWREGNTLPLGYLGCVNKGKVFKEAEVCPGDQSFVIFNRRGTYFIAQEGKGITEARC